MLNKLAHSQQSGFGMIEALVALLVISFGLLGIAALQLTSLQQAASAQWHSQAAWFAYDMADRISANSSDNPDVVDNYIDIDTENDYSEDCQESACTPAQMAVADAEEWSDAVQTLPGGRGVISRPLGGDVVMISIMWNDNSGESNCINDEPAGDDQSCFSMSIQ